MSHKEFVKAVGFAASLAYQLADAMNCNSAVEPKLMAGSAGPLSECKVTTADGRPFVDSIARGEMWTPLADHLRALLTPGSSESSSFAHEHGFNATFICLYWVGEQQIDGFKAYGTGKASKPCGFVLVHTKDSSRLLKVPTSASGEASFSMNGQLGELAIASHPLMMLWEKTPTLSLH